MEGKIKILIADDHEMICEAMKSLLVTVPQFDVIGTVSNGKEALKAVEELGPDVVIMDIVMPEMNGLAATTALKEKYGSDIRIMMLSMEVTNEYVKSAFQSNVDGYIPKNADFDILKNGIFAIHKGEKYYDQKIKDYIFQYYMKGESSEVPELKSLSEREVQVLKMISEGVANKEIGEALFISPKTVETHRNNILKKLKLKSTADLIKYAIAKNVTDIPKHMYEE